MKARDKKHNIKKLCLILFFTTFTFQIIAESEYAKANTNTSPSEIIETGVLSDVNDTIKYFILLTIKILSGFVTLQNGF